MYTYRLKLQSSFHKGFIFNIIYLKQHSVYFKQVRHTKGINIGFKFTCFYHTNLTKVHVCKNIFFFFKKPRHSLFECALFKTILCYSIKNIVVYKWKIKPLNFIYFCSISCYPIGILQHCFFNFLVLINKDWWHINILLTNKEPLNVLNFNLKHVELINCHWAIIHWIESLEYMWPEPWHVWSEWGNFQK